MATAAWSPESPREVVGGLDPAVLAAGPPPVPTLTGTWRVRVADPRGGDAKLISDWMACPHVARFWEQAWPVERWSAVLRRQLAGEYTRPLIARRDGIDLGYLEVYRTPRDVVGRHYPADPHDLGIHIAIGPLDAIGKGTGGQLVRALLAALFEVDPRCTRVVADPDAAHVVARRMFARAGFALTAEVDLGHKRAALMSCERPALPSHVS